MPTADTEEDIKRNKQCKIAFAKKSDSRMVPTTETITSSATSTVASLSVMSSSTITKEGPVALAVKNALTHSTNQTTLTPILPNITTQLITRPIPPKKPARPPVIASTADYASSEIISKCSSNQSSTSTSTSSSSVTCSASSLSSRTSYSSATSSTANHSFRGKSSSSTASSSSSSVTSSTTSSSSSSSCSSVREEFQASVIYQGRVSDTAIASHSMTHTNQKCEKSSWVTTGNENVNRSAAIIPVHFESSYHENSSSSTRSQSSAILSNGSGTHFPVNAPVKPLKPLRNDTHTRIQDIKSLSPPPLPSPLPPPSPLLLQSSSLSVPCKSIPADDEPAKGSDTTHLIPHPVLEKETITATSTSTTSTSATTRSSKILSHMTVMEEVTTIDSSTLFTYAISTGGKFDRRFLVESFPERRSTYALSMKVSSYTNNPTAIVNVLDWQLMVLPPKVFQPSIVANRITQFTKSTIARPPDRGCAPVPVLNHVPAVQSGHRSTRSDTLHGTGPPPHLTPGPIPSINTKNSKEILELPTKSSSQYKSELKVPAAAAQDCATISCKTLTEATLIEDKLNTSIRMESDLFPHTTPHDSSYGASCVDTKNSGTFTITPPKGKLFPNSCTTYEKKKNISRQSNITIPAQDSVILANEKNLLPFSSSSSTFSSTPSSSSSSTSPTPSPAPCSPCRVSSSSPSSPSPSMQPVDHKKHSYVPSTSKTTPIYIPKIKLTPST